MYRDGDAIYADATKTSLLGLRGRSRVLDPEYLTVSNVLHAQYGGISNFITPTFCASGARADKRLVWEISSGSGIMGNTIYGVTVVEYDPETAWTYSRRDLSKPFGTREEADKYIADTVSQAELLCDK
jgi:hypothetical protein